MEEAADAAREERVHRLMTEFGFTEAEALQILAEAGDGDVRSDPPLTDEERRHLGLTGRPITEDPRFPFLKDRVTAGLREP